MFFNFKMNFRQTVLTACLVLLTAAPLTVKAAPVHIEVIVFAHTGTKHQSTEWFERESERIVVEPVELDVPTTAEPEVEGPEQPIPVQSKELTNIAKILEEHPDYELLNYLSWVQEPVRKRDTISVSLDIEHPDSFIIPQLLLSGEISLYEVQQLLQTEINATYSPQPRVIQDTVYLPEAVTLYSVPPEYRLEDRRQVKIGELHYFDHPKFGVIFYMVRPENPEFFIQ